MSGPTMPCRTRGPRRSRGSFALLLALAACGGGGYGSGSSALTPDVIGPDEISASSATNAFDLVRQVRPNWMRGRGTPNLRGSQAPLPVVYLEDRRQGALEILRTFPTGGVAELRYINATTATTRFGNGHAGGVIQVVPRRR